MRRRTLNGKSVIRRYFEEEELLTEDKVFDGGYISEKDGTVVDFANWVYTDFIEIGPKEIIVVPVNDVSTSYNAFYDKDYNFIKKLSVLQNSSNFLILKIPENAKYIRFSWRYTTPITTIKRITLTE